MWTHENILKGRMAEALVAELLSQCGNKVYRFGYETVLQNLTQVDSSFDRQSEVGQQIISIPDFLVLNEAGSPFFLEVKFRSLPDCWCDEDLTMFKNIQRFWKAKIILVTPDMPYFRITQSPYFDNQGKPTFEELQDDGDLHIRSRKLRKFNRSVEKYFPKIRGNKSLHGSSEKMYGGSS
jgi:hypothetical protein